MMRARVLSSSISLPVVAVFVVTIVVTQQQPVYALVARLFRGGHSMPPVIEDTPAVTKLPPKILDNRGLDYIFEKNKEWKDSKLESDRKYFQKLGTSTTPGSATSPEYMYIGCVDSTVPENLMMGEESSNIFVHRNVANLVVESDMNLLSAIQYAVSVLKVKDIIVCGHYNCGGIRGALGAADNTIGTTSTIKGRKKKKKKKSPKSASSPMIDPDEPLLAWSQYVRQVYEIHEAELDEIDDPSDRYRRFVQLVVIEQCKNLFKFDVLKKQRKNSFLEGEMLPRVHAMIFDPKTGNLKRIPFDFSEFAEG